MDAWTLLNEAFGALNWQHRPGVSHPLLPTDRLYRAELTYRGSRILINRNCKSKGGTADGGLGHGYISRWFCSLAVPCGSRELVMSTSKSSRGWANVELSDPTFERHYRVSGAPAQILKSAFEPSLRSYMVSLAHLKPVICTEARMLELDLSWFVERQGGDPATLRQLADLFLAVSSRVFAEYDRGHEQARALGPAALDQFQSEQAIAVFDARQRSTTRGVLLIMFGFLAFGMLFVLFVVLAVVF